MKQHTNNCKHSFIISIMEKIYIKDNFDQNGPSYTSPLSPLEAGQKVRVAPLQKRNELAS